MTRTGQVARPVAENDSETLIEWIQDHTREVAFVALAIVAVMFGIWLYQYLGASKAAKAEVLLAQAETSIATQRLPEAQTSLQRLVDSYRGTPAAGQGLLRLAQLFYDQGKFQDGVTRLEGAFGTYDDGAMAVSVRQLSAAGYEQLGKPGDAAARYAEAAEKATLSGERDELRARAARAWADAGDKAKALEVWRSLVGKPGSPLANEARIRVGELTAVPAGATPG